VGLRSKLVEVVIGSAKLAYLTGRWCVRSDPYEAVVYFEIVSYILVFIPYYEFVDCSQIHEIQGERC